MNNKIDSLDECDSQISIEETNCENLKTISLDDSQIVLISAEGTKYEILKKIATQSLFIRTTLEGNKGSKLKNGISFKILRNILLTHMLYIFFQ